jgi:hypothetical protein
MSNKRKASGGSGVASGGSGVAKKQFNVQQLLRSEASLSPVQLARLK